jgi:hypothetical protein
MFKKSHLQPSNIAIERIMGKVLTRKGKDFDTFFGLQKSFLVCLLFGKVAL